MAIGARASGDALPSVYLVLLDGYPRADKLAAEFGIHNEPFLHALGQRGFDVAEWSRSNYLATDQSLASMFGAWTPSRAAADVATLRTFINEGSVLGTFRDLGYETFATSTAIEGVAVRQADRFVDTGQMNEAEWQLLARGGVGRVQAALAPTWFADQHRDRLFATLAAAESIAGETTGGRPRLALLHIMSPHAPLVVDVNGAPVGTTRWTSLDDGDEYAILGSDEYARRLAGQIAFVNARTLHLVDTITAADPQAIIVVFSDHGSGIRESDEGSDPDLRSANLLAVRAPGRGPLIDDRSTLVNLLPRILRSITGVGPGDAPEAIWQQEADGAFVEFERPD